MTSPRLPKKLGAAKKTAEKRAPAKQVPPKRPAKPRVAVIKAQFPLNKNGFLLEGRDVLDDKGRPTYTVSEVSKFFFARSPHWMRWAESRNYFTLDGRDVGDSRTEQGARIYTLFDVEQMAHALAQHGAMNGAQLHGVLSIIAASARQWGFIQ